MAKVFFKSLMMVAFLVSQPFAIKYPPFALGSFVLEPKEGKTLEVKNLVSQFGLKIKDISPSLRSKVVYFPVEIDTCELRRAQEARDYERLWELYWAEADRVLTYVAEFRSSGLVKYAEPNYLLYATYTPNDQYFVDDGNYRPDGGPDQFGCFIMRCQEGWDITRGSPYVKIAILDSGVDIDHPDLFENIWVNPGEDIDRDGIPYDLDDLNGVDDDGNGYIDDLNGYDFVGGQKGLMVGDLPVTSEDWNPDVHYYGDDGWGVPDPSVGDGLDMFGTPGGFLFPADMGVGHGTHTAGIAGAVMDNNLYFAGAGGHCKIMVIRAITPEGTGNESDIASGIAYAADNGANVLSLSLGDLGFGASPPQALVEAIEYAYRRGVTIVAAAGNNGNRGISFPASSPYTLAVGSCNSRRQRSSFSQYGSGLDVLAPGGEANLTSGVYSEVIWSTWVASIAEARDSGLVAGEHYIKGEAGTSMACPYVSGLAGLILSLNPTLPPDSVYNIIRRTAQDIPPSGWDEQTGYGIVDFGEALRRVGVVETAGKPSVVTLGLPYPNPANASLHIPITLNKPMEVTLEVYNILGQRIKRLLQCNLDAGKYDFVWDTGELIESSGMYFIRLGTPYGDKMNACVIIK